MAESNKKSEFGYLLYLMFFLQGMASLIPWNCFLNSMKYFEKKELDPNCAGGFVYISLWYAVTKTMCVIVKSVLPFTIGNPHRLIFFCVLGTGFVLVFLAVCGFILTGFPLLYAVIASAICLAILVTLAEIGYYPLLSLFPPIYMQAFSTGYGFSGVLTSGSELITKSFDFRDFYLLVYLLPSIIIITSALLTYCLIFPRDARSKKIYKELAAGFQRTNGNASSRQLNTVALLNRVKYFLLGFFIVLTTTFAVYPALVYRAKTTTENEKYRELYPALGSFSYNLGNICGKLLSSAKLFTTRRGGIIFLLNLLRLGTITPLFLWTILATKQTNFLGLSQEALFFFCAFIFGFTSGNLITLSLMHAPNSIPNADSGSKERIGRLNVLILNSGILAGILTSISIIKYLV